MVKRPKGIVRIFSRGRLLYECRNLFVDAGLPALANLLAGVTAGQFALAVGFGSGNATPAASDVDLALAPKYYNAVGAHTFPSPGSVQFSYALRASADFAAAGITVQEVGLFANAAGVALPAAVGTNNPTWSASTAKTVGSLLVDANGNVQRCTTAGTSGATPPTWAMALGATTTDGSVVWTLAALNAPPGPMLAHAVVPAFAFNGSADYQGTWTFTF
ncbi:MAG TPA: hypothetical protein VFB33_05425 [Candidatus Binataceae bacterium]|jgi:hypothetical protein|nr:hypothetical protein [Candidatus Binataceae bacterium]